MRARTLLALLTVQVLFGLWPVAGKLVFAYIDPLPLTAVRTLGATLFLAVAHRFLVRRPVQWRRDGNAVMVLAFLGIVVNQALFALGLQLTSAVHATLIVTTIPVFTYAIAVAFGKETIGPRRALGIGLALVGVVYLLGIPESAPGPNPVLGDLLVAANALSFAAFLVFSRPVLEHVSPLSLTTWTMGIGAAVLLPVGLVAGLPAQAMAAPPEAWWLVLLIVLGPTVGTYLLNATALRDTPASTVAVFIYLQPIVAASTAWWLLDEPLSLRLLPAALCVFAGVWLVARRRPKVLQGAPGLTGP